MQKTQFIKSISTEKGIKAVKSNNLSQTATPAYRSFAQMSSYNPFEQLHTDLSDIKMMLRQLLDERITSTEKSDLIDLNEASQLLKMGKSSIYKLTANKKIPFIKREGGSKLIFSRSDLTAWMRESNAFPVDMVDSYLRKNLRGRDRRRA